MFLKFVSLFLLTFILAFDAKPNGNSTPKEQGIQVPVGIKCLLYSNAKPEIASHSQSLEILSQLKNLQMNMDNLTRTNAVADKKANCTDGWVNHGKSCFLIIDIPTKWSDARRTCQKLGGDLAKITSADEDKFITDLMFKQKTVTLYGVWLGLHRKADKKFYWTDGTPLGSYKPWGKGEPGSSEGCVNIFGVENRRGKWNDLTCSYSDVKAAPVILCQKSSK